MGIQGFFNYIINKKKANGKYNSRIFKNDTNRYILDRNDDELKDLKISYDFLFLDFQSGIYQTKNELKEYDPFVFYRNRQHLKEIEAKTTIIPQNFFYNYYVLRILN